MPQFRTSIPPIDFPFEFHHQTPAMCIGSCFAEHIGARLVRSKIPVLLNPFGILYNPYSIGNTLECLLSSGRVPAQQIIAANGLWHSFDHHGQFSKPERSELIKAIDDRSNQAIAHLKNTNRLILTFGTSNAFRHKATNQIVANCHKIPNAEFDRIVLSTEQIVDKLQPTFQKLKRQFPHLEILLTVSPVRHIRDGLIENQRSKARLLLACDQLSTSDEFIHYFPSYEMVVDDLRDYRFYEKDMIHPNEVAIDYIWDYFSHCFFKDKTQELISKISKIQNAVNHRPFNPDSTAHQNFISQQLSLMTHLENQFGFLDFSKEKERMTM